MTHKKPVYIILIVLFALIGFGLWWSDYNKIVGTIYGAELDEIIVNDITYVMTDEHPSDYHGSESRNKHIGKGAWQDGTVELDLYTIKGDAEFNYLFARSGYDGQLYVRESISLSKMSIIRSECTTNTYPRLGYFN